MGIGPDELSFWQEEWSAYKRTARLTEAQEIRDQLTNCCTDEVHRDLFRSLGSSQEREILCGKDTRLGNVLMVDCTGTACQEKVSYAEQEILNILVKGLHDGETKEEVLTHR